jgi:hypothetical protein
MKAAIAALAVVLAICAAMNVMLYQRVAALEAKMSGKTARHESAAPAHGAVVPDERTRNDERGTPDDRSVPQPVTGKAAGTPGPAPDRILGGPATAEVSPALKSMIAAEVDRAVKEKVGDLPRITRMEDPMAVMEKELGLSPNQKMEIGALWQKREDEMKKTLHDAKMADMPDKMKELETRYDGLIKSHLDLGQQAKYDALKKDGKLMGGGVVFHMEVKEEGPPK